MDRRLSTTRAALDKPCRVYAGRVQGLRVRKRRRFGLLFRCIGECPRLRIAHEAERYYRSGPPLLQRYLPFWLANLIDRMWVALFSLIAVVIPLSRVVPPLYEFRVRSRIFRWYRQLRQIEDRLGRDDAPAAELLAELDRLEAKARGITVPLSHTDELYELRSHIALVRGRLQQQIS